MSIFISELAFTNDTLIDQAKVGILAASFAAGILGVIVLSYVLPKQDYTDRPRDTGCGSNLHISKEH